MKLAHQINNCRNMIHGRKFALHLETENKGYQELMNEIRDI